MRSIDLDLHPNEASDLLPLTCAAVLEAHRWDHAYYTVLDEGTVENSIAVIGHRAGADLDDGWENHILTCDSGQHTGKTEDGEAAAAHDGHAYFIGSHYGKKGGPLHPIRAWIARLDETQLTGELEGCQPRLEVLRDKFDMHRKVNDALAASDLELIALDDDYEAAFITAARERGEKKNKKWASRLRAGDFPMNIEAAAFRPNGNLLLGLRFPVTRAGEPVLVEVAGVQSAFEADDADLLDVVAVHALKGPGSDQELVGFRALTHTGEDRFCAVLGSLDATDKGSLLLDAYPAGAGAVNEHWTFTLDGHAGYTDAQLRQRFADLQKIEGIAQGPDGHYLYVVDEDHRVHVRFLYVD